MKGKKAAVLITYLFGILIGAISYFLNNYIFSVISCVILYYSLYLAFRRIFEIKEFFSSTALGYFGLWFIVWTILINLIG
ncbi:MAG: hypothetical protein RMJ18_02715 [Candidatus Aenigmarchaeota archaeon]|nr:hypothetical protein [Candidatus Aenigmarchaeota archaeon]MDW8160303.1 hypothetical protein [Candidatus Aenigmarchaeota archaeon]